jgi:hypothetical protein
MLSGTQEKIAFSSYQGVVYASTSMGETRVLGGLIGAIGIMIVGFGWLGWTLGSTAESLAQERVNTALVAAFTPVCVEKFMTQPNAPVKLTEFQKTSAWRQQEFVEKGGWATLPGSKEPNTKVVGACAGQLTKTNKT